MNDRERKDNELGIDLDMKGLTLDSDEAAKPQAQNRPMSHEDMARMIAKNMAMQDGGFDEPITPVRGVSDFGEETIKPKKPKTTETRSKNVTETKLCLVSRFFLWSSGTFDLDI